jgi:hypothetical protein
MNWPVTPGGDPVSRCHLMAYSPSPALTKACCKMGLFGPPFFQLGERLGGAANLQHSGKTYVKIALTASIGCLDKCRQE